MYSLGALASLLLALAALDPALLVLAGRDPESEIRQAVISEIYITLDTACFNMPDVCYR